MQGSINKNNPAGVKFEIVPFDNKVSPQESLIVLKKASQPVRGPKPPQTSFGKVAQLIWQRN